MIRQQMQEDAKAEQRSEALQDFFKQHTLQNGVVQFAVSESETTETDWMQYAAILLKQKGKKENEDQ